MRTRLASLATAILVPIAITAIGCAEPPPEPAPVQRIENHELGIAIANVPSPFVIDSNEGAVLELRAPGDLSEGVLFFETTDEMSGGINLVAEAESMQDWYEQQPEGQYFGNLELGTPLGPAFTSRGTYLLDGAQIEEIRVFAIHPTSNRLLRLTYRYGPGEGKERLQQLAVILGEIEGVFASDQEASSVGSES